MEEGLGDVELADPAQKLVLVVDDEESQQDLLKHIVGKEGFRLDLAKDGSEALRKVEAMSPDLIILDLMLPGTSGYEVLRGLQSTGNGNIPVIVLTARTMDRKMVEMVRQESNVREFVQKPASPLILASTLHNILRTCPPAVKRTPKKG
ncbi:MAG: hypothetical protein A3J74_07465 [Elusimicrobia bacterium RIFCSPHIGHO2_02_FULL_57_9]|nr:MAG: hypothetical protein A3J74_07465 [Elusimicrobia bacterium RIFCSPHIGHO2_02_FULL_57_9]